MTTNMIIFSNYLLIILSQPIFLAIISLCPLRLDISLSLLSLSPISFCSPLPDLSLLSSDLSHLSPVGESRERSGGEERSAGEREERAYICFELGDYISRTTTEKHRLEMMTANHRLETTPARTTTTHNNQW